MAEKQNKRNQLFSHYFQSVPKLKADFWKADQDVLIVISSYWKKDKSVFLSNQTTNLELLHHHHRYSISVLFIVVCTKILLFTQSLHEGQ